MWSLNHEKANMKSVHDCTQPVLFSYAKFIWICSYMKNKLNPNIIAGFRVQKVSNKHKILNYFYFLQTNILTQSINTAYILDQYLTERETVQQ